MSATSAMSSTFNMDKTTSSSSSFFKRSLTLNANSTTITGKSSAIKRDVGIKLIEVQEQVSNPKEAKRKRKEQEKESLKKSKSENTQKSKPEERLTESENTVEDSEDQNLDLIKQEVEIEKTVPYELASFTTNHLPTFSTNPAQFNNQFFYQHQQMNQLPTSQHSTLNDLFQTAASHQQSEQFKNNYLTSSNFSSPLLLNQAPGFTNEPKIEPTRQQPSISLTVTLILFLCLA